jgi:hypothetical protein
MRGLQAFEHYLVVSAAQYLLWNTLFSVAVGILCCFGVRVVSIWWGWIK